MTMGNRLRISTGRRQLFLDDFIIAEAKNLERTMHRPVKKGAVIQRDLLPSSIDTLQTRTAPIWDPREGVYKFWVLTGGGQSAYLESRDGVIWEMGSDMNLPVTMAVRDATEHDRTRRYKAALLNSGFATSPDGVNWSKIDAPAISSSDEGNFSFDEEGGLFIHTVKRGGPFGRAVGLATSRDFERWEDHGLVFHADEEDQDRGRANIRRRLADTELLPPLYNDPTAYNVDVYNMGIFRYEDYYIGMPAMFHATGPIPNYPNTDGFHLVQLVFSRDLNVWTRLANRQTFIGPSPTGTDAYDLTQIIGPSCPLLRDDELWFYYTGIKYRAAWTYEGDYPNGRHVPIPGLDSDQSAICLAVLRRDGFISMKAGEDGGYLVTKPLDLDGDRLYVNVDAPDGELRIDVLGAERETILESKPITGDFPGLEVGWHDGSLKDVNGKGMVLCFKMRNADLYSFWLE